MDPVTTIASAIERGQPIPFELTVAMGDDAVWQRAWRATHDLDSKVYLARAGAVAGRGDDPDAEAALIGAALAVIGRARKARRTSAEAVWQRDIVTWINAYVAGKTTDAGREFIRVRFPVPFSVQAPATRAAFAMLQSLKNGALEYPHLRDVFAFATSGGRYHFTFAMAALDPCMPSLARLVSLGGPL